MQPVHSVFGVTCGAVCAVLTAGPPRIWKVMMMDSPEQNTKSATEFFTQRDSISHLFIYMSNNLIYDTHVVPLVDD